MYLMLTSQNVNKITMFPKSDDFENQFLYRKWVIFGILKVLFYRVFIFFFIFFLKVIFHQEFLDQVIYERECLSPFMFIYLMHLLIFEQICMYM
jgi:hypothetical protein